MDEYGKPYPQTLSEFAHAPRKGWANKSHSAFLELPFAAQNTKEAVINE